MKRFFSILLISFFAACVISSAQWKQIIDIPIQFRYNYWLEIYFLPDNPSYGWCCGYNGMVIRTTDGGNSWQGTKIKNAGQIESIHFVNEKTGYVVSVTSLTGYGSSVVYKSTDGGATWKDISPAENIPLWGCRFLNENYGMVIGGECWGDNIFYLTRDGGNTWTSKVYHESNTKLSDLVLYPDGSGFAVSSGRIWQTLDSGKTWKIYCKVKDKDWHEELAVSGKSFLLPYDPQCSGSSNNGGGGRYSSDNGQQWKDFFIGEPCYGSVLTSDSTGWFCGKNRAIYYISDWGKNIEDKHCGIPEGTNLDDLYFFNDSAGFVVGEGIYKYKEIVILEPVIASENRKICEGESTVITATAEFEHYLWNTGDTTRSINVSATGDYSLIVNTDECDSALSNTIHIEYFPKPEAKFENGNSYLLCEGDTAIVHFVSNKTSILWDDGSSDVIKRFSSSGVYYYTVADSNGCTARDSVTVTLLPYPVAEIVPSSVDTLLCQGLSLTLTSKVGITGGNTADWYNAETNELLASGTSSIEIDSSSKIYIIAHNEAGCSDTSEICTYNITYSDDHFDFGNSDVVFIDTVIAGNSAVGRITIENKTNSVKSIYDITLLHNLEFSVPQYQLPLVIQPYDSASLIIVFSPNALKLRSDTLVMTDICSSHLIILTGFCKPYIRQSEGGCGIGVVITTKQLPSGASFTSSQPYPNPATASGKICVDYTYKSKNANYAFSPKINFTDVSGIEFSADYSVNKNSGADDNYAVIENGTIIIDVSQISAGTYFIHLYDGKEQIETLKVIVK